MPIVVPYLTPVEPIICCDAVEPCCSHCLLAALVVMHGITPANEFKACCALHIAESMLGGIIGAQQRKFAIMAGAMHVMAMSEVGQVDAMARLNAVASGEPSPPATVPDDYWIGSVHGSMVKQFIRSNPRSGFVGI